MLRKTLGLLRSEVRNSVAQAIVCVAIGYKDSSRSPHEVQQGTTMPDVLHGMDQTQRLETAQAIAAFLSSQVEPFPTLKAGGALPVIHEFWRKGDPERGGELYHQVGCVACHQPDPEFEASAFVPSPIDALLEQLEPEDLQEMGLARAARRVESIPHGDLNAKYSARALTMMLLDPASVRPDARMPSLRLQPVDAADIAAYLMRGQAIEPDLEPMNNDSDRIETGRRMFQELRCVNCHDTRESMPRRLAKPLASLGLDAPSSCLQQPQPEMPRYRLDNMQLHAVNARLRKLDAKEAPTASATAQHRMLQLNCYACHERRRAEDGEVLGGVGRFRKPYFETTGHIDLGDEGRLPPPLTAVGHKLLPAALESVFTDKAAPRRPFMTIRMPAYQQNAVAELIELFPKADGLDTSTEKAVFGKGEGLAEAGRELVNTGCVECHAFRGESLPGAIGIDLHDIGSRVQPKWFYEFVLNPGEVKARTRMPTFFPDGQSNRKDLLDGDTRRQIAAMWYYLKKTEPLPEKIAEAMSKDFELVPADRPIVLRTFMPEAGTHAIAVGLPGGLNFAFDAEQVRMATAWKGRFLDARSTWFERFAPPSEPLGEHVIALPAGPSFFFTTHSSRPSSQLAVAEQRLIEFAGYRVDQAGIPTFLYRLGPWDIEDRMEARDQESLLRTWTIRRSDRPAANENESAISLCPHAARQLKSVRPMSMVDQNGLTVTVTSEGNHQGEIVRFESLQHWLIPLEDKQEQVFKAEYRW